MMQTIDRATDIGNKRMLRLVRECPLFERASRATREELARAASYELVMPGAILVEQGATSRNMILLPRGRARLERSGGPGRLLALGYRGSGDVLLDEAISREGRARVQVTATAESEVLRVAHDDARQILARDPGLAMAALEAMLAQKRELEDRLESVLFRNVEGRLAEFLLQAADRWGVQRPDGVMIAAPITHLEIAQAIGSTRETVTLTLGMLRREGLIVAIGRKLCIVDRPALLERAQ